MSIQKSTKIKIKEYNLIEVIKLCAKSRVSMLRIGDLEIEFDTGKQQEEPKVTEATAKDPEFEKETKAFKEEQDEMDDEVRKDNEILEDFEKHEEKEILRAIEVG